MDQITKITMTVSKSERDVLEQQAKKESLSISNYIRRKIGMAPVKIGRRPAKQQQ